MKRLLAIPFVLLLLLAGVMVLSGSADVKKRAEFSFINRGDIFTLDLNQMSYMQDFRLTYGIREGLYDLDPKNFRPIPAVALGVDVSEDKLVWTFHLRRECKWSNGDPVTSRDFLFSWRRMLEEPGEYTYLFHYVRNGTEYERSYARGEPIDFKTVGIEAPDEMTFRVSLDNPVPYLLDIVAFPPFYPRHERSMAKFRIFSDEDVMDVLRTYVDAAHHADRSGSADEVARRFAAKVECNHRIGADAVAQWLEFASHFDLSTSTQDELLGALKKFAELDPFPPAAARPAPAAAATTAMAAPPGEDEAPPDLLSPLPPVEKLNRMLAGRFIRHTYNKAYTLPPDVVTNGPFVLSRWDFKRRLLLDKSQTYWDKEHVKLNSIEMVVAESPQNQLLMYETGQVDWNSDVAGDQAAELKAKGRTDLHSSPAFGTAFLTLVCSAKLPASLGGGANPLADVRVRRALAMSVDKRFIVNNLTRMGELPARTYFPPDGTLPEFTWLPGPYSAASPAVYHFEEMQQRLKTDEGLQGAGPGLPYDPDRARKLLAEAGYPNGRNFPSLPILYNTNSPIRRDICQVVKNQWKETLNIDVNIEGVEGKIFSNRVSHKDYWIATVAWYGDYPDVSTFTDKYLSDSLQNDSAWVNPKFDDLCAQAKREPDAAKRMQFLREAESLIDNDVPIIPTYHYVNLSLSRPGVNGVLPNSRNITIFKNVSVNREGR